MNPLTTEWVDKAEADYAGASALARRRKVPLPDLVCFHCQQGAEKYLKAWLQEAGVAFPKTHVLTDLLTLATGPNPALNVLQPQLVLLEDYAVKARYPGLSCTVGQSAAALRALREVRRLLRSHLGITPPRRKGKGTRRRRKKKS